ncbi:unnamed protein product [Closterium sp. NIES-54]
MLLHVAAQRDYELHSLDFSTAFLQGSLHEEIWLRRPPGFTGSFLAGTQWSLRRPVYGLRQAPCEWHDTLRTTLAALGFAPSTADPSLFLRSDTTLPPLYDLVYVDVLVFATTDTEALAHVKSELQKRHTCTDVGELTSYLGLRITRDRVERTITLTQSHMVQQVLQRFGFTYSSPQSTPLPTSHSLSAPPSDESVEPSGLYLELVGCLIWLELVRQGVDIFTLDHDAILTAMYALSASTEGDYSWCVPPDPGIAAAALGASESGTLPGTAPAKALHTFTLDSGLHLPLFSMNLVSTAVLQDAMVTTTTLGGQRVSICTCTWTGRHLATCLYTLATEPPQVAASAQVSASGQLAASCSCRLLSHQTLLWHHRLGHPSLPSLRGMHSRLLVSGLPRSLPPLPPSPAPPSQAPPSPAQPSPAPSPCVEGWQRAAPHLFIPHDVWSPADSPHGRVGPSPHVVSSRPTSCGSFVVGRAFSSRSRFRPLRRKMGLLRVNIGLIMEVARTSMIHAAAPHFRSPFVVRYAAHQLIMWPHVSLPETSPTLRWTGEVGDASVFRVWGSRAFVRNTTADKLSACAIPCVFLGFVPEAPGWQFYHPTSHRVFPSHDITFHESVPFYRLLPYRSVPLPPPPLFLAPGPPLVDTLPPQGPPPSGVSQVVPLPSTVPVEVAVGSGAAQGAASGGAASGGAEPGVLSLRVRSLGLSPQQLREWLVRRARLRSGATGAGGTGDVGAGGAGVTAGACGTGGTAATSPGGARTRGTGAAGTGGSCAGGAGAGGAGVGGTGAGGARAAGAGAVDPRVEGAGGTMRPRAYVVPLLQLVLSVLSSTSLTPPLLCPPPDQSQLPLLTPSPLPAPSPYTEQFGALTELRELASCPVSPSVAASALVGEMVDFAAACRLDYATALVTESASASPPSVGDPDAPDIPTPRSYAEAITGTYVDENPPRGVNIVDGMWIFRVKRPPGSPRAFKARYVA